MTDQVITDASASAPVSPRADVDPNTARLLQVTDLTTYFDTPTGSVRAVDGVSFDLEDGQTLGVVGESGSGKTVLSRSVMNLLPKNNVTRSGSVRLRGEELLGRSDKEMRASWGPEMAMVFQDPMVSLNPVVRIGNQLVESMREHFDFSKTELRQRSLELLRSVRIPEPERRLKQYPHELSGGMRQRVVIAIALSCEPSLLFADEPTTALDVTVQAQILDLLSQQQRERAMGMIFVSHDLGIMAGRADNVMVMYAGQAVEKAPTRPLFQETKMPYTEALLGSTPRMHAESHIRMATISGRPPNPLAFPPACRFAPRCQYAQERCVEEMPPLVASEADPAHEYRCWYPVDSPAGEEAFARNLARGKTATGLLVSSISS